MDSFTQVTGLSHLEGCTVGVLADGNSLGTLQVNDGKITLVRSAMCVHVGLLYQAQLQTLPAVFQLVNGPTADQKKRIVSVTLQFVDSRGGKAAEGSGGAEGGLSLQGTARAGRKAPSGAETRRAGDRGSAGGGNKAERIPFG